MLGLVGYIPKNNPIPADTPNEKSIDLHVTNVVSSKDLTKAIMLDKNPHNIIPIKPDTTVKIILSIKNPSSILCILTFLIFYLIFLTLG